MVAAANLEADDPTRHCYRLDQHNPRPLPMYPGTGHTFVLKMKIPAASARRIRYLPDCLPVILWGGLSSKRDVGQVFTGITMIMVVAKRNQRCHTLTEIPRCLSHHPLSKERHANAPCLSRFRAQASDSRKAERVAHNSTVPVFSHSAKVLRFPLARILCSRYADCIGCGHSCSPQSPEPSV